MMMMMIIIIIIIIKALLFFLSIFGTRPNFFNILEEVRYAEYAGSTEIGNTFC